MTRFLRISSVSDWIGFSKGNEMSTTISLPNSHIKQNSRRLFLLEFCVQTFIKINDEKSEHKSF